MTFSPDQSVLVIIDVQGNLALAVEEHTSMIRHIQSLIQIAQYLGVPIIYSEQVPDKIGETIKDVARFLDNAKPVIKKTFSCCGAEEFNQKLAALKRPQVIICGIEAHVCVYQTVMDLIKNDYFVQVVVDAVSSRNGLNKKIAFKRIEQSGAFLTTTEMIATELLKTSAHPQFKDILRLIK